MQNQYNRLSGTASLGESAASQTGQYGTNAAATGGNALMAAGNASAAGTMGVANAATGGVNSYLQNNALNAYLGTGGTAGYGNTIQPYGANNAIPGNTIMSAYG